uniref:Uncharacterized protein n=1 Tax=Rhizophora mucronata TaxID=61149 RepID=A0A2P2M3A2_RHIMU
MRKGIQIFLHSHPIHPCEGGDHVTIGQRWYVFKLKHNEDMQVQY